MKMGNRARANIRICRETATTVHSSIKRGIMSDTSLLYSAYVLVCRINRDFIRD
jgi:hypothetical protein